MTKDNNRRTEANGKDYEPINDSTRSLSEDSFLETKPATQ